MATPARMATSAPSRARGEDIGTVELRGADLLVVVAFLNLCDVVLNFAKNYFPVGVPEHATSGVVLKVEEIELAADQTMIVSRSDIASS